MGYFLTTSPENVVPGKFLVPPQTHTPGSRLEKRGYRFYVPESGRLSGLRLDQGRGQEPFQSAMPGRGAVVEDDSAHGRLLESQPRGRLFADQD
jgi:hypothetical protein